MNAQEIAVCSAVMLFASTIRSAFGFGEALIAVPLLALMIPVETAAPIAVLSSIVIAGYVLFRDWRHVHFRSAALLVLSTMFGVPLGLRHQALTLRNDRFAWPFGFAAGVFGGAYGLNGPPLVVYGSLRGWMPEKFRATLQGYFLPASIAGMLGYRAAGLWTPAVDRLFLWCLPSVVIGIFAGRMISRRLQRERFLRVVHWGLCLIGGLLLLQAAAGRAP